MELVIILVVLLGFIIASQTIDKKHDRYDSHNDNYFNSFPSSDNWDNDCDCNNGWGGSDCGDSWGGCDCDSGGDCGGGDCD